MLIERCRHGFCRIAAGKSHANRRRNFRFAYAQPLVQPGNKLPHDASRHLSLTSGAFNAQLIQHPLLVRNYRLETLRVGSGYWSLHVRRDLPAPGPLRSS